MPSCRSRRTSHVAYWSPSVYDEEINVVITTVSRLGIVGTDWKKDHPDKPLTELGDFKFNKMIGTDNDQTLKVKALECWGLLLYVRGAFARYREIIGVDLADVYIEALDCLIRYTEIMKSCGVNVPIQSHQEACF